jgi:putative transposase
MTRLARSTIIGYPHLVCQEGNYGQTVFDDHGDFQRYLAWLAEYFGRYSIGIWAYCLMRNHVDFICVPRSEEALARGFNTLHMRYAQYFHAKKGITGHLWRGRFLSCMLDSQSVFEEVRYIENGPVRTGFVAQAEEYRWSSARRHVLGEADPIMGDSCFLENEIQEWRAYLASPGEDAVLARTRKCLKTGRPAGGTDWIRGLEVILDRRLEALPRGRPRKVKLDSGIHSSGEPR